jgi:hypothetical protein
MTRSLVRVGDSVVVGRVINTRTASLLRYDGRSQVPVDSTGETPVFLEAIPPLSAPAWNGPGVWTGAETTIYAPCEDRGSPRA